MKGQPNVDPGIFWPDPIRFFLYKEKKLGFLGEIFQTLWLLSQTGSKNFDLAPSLWVTLISYGPSLKVQYCKCKSGSFKKWFSEVHGQTFAIHWIGPLWMVSMICFKCGYGFWAINTKVISQTCNIFCSWLFSSMLIPLRKQSKESSLVLDSWWR